MRDLWDAAQPLAATKERFGFRLAARLNSREETPTLRVSDSLWKKVAVMSQLRLEKDDLENVPRIVVPTGYVLRNYREGDEAGIGRVYAAAGLEEGSVESVRRRIIAHPCFTPGRLFVIEHAGEIVGTAAAWIEAENDPGVGYLHMIGVMPEHRGKRLGAILSIAAIEYTRNEGFTRQRLSTDDWREAAIRLYLDLGYYPLICDETHPARWAALAEKLDRMNAVALGRVLSPAPSGPL